jgi:Flp pilus assembly protein TadB
MTSKILLRIAAALILLHNVGHTLGHVNWKKAPDEVNRRAIDAMTSNEFMFMGEKSTYARFFDGYGYAGTLTLLLAMILLWMLSGVQSKLSKQLTIVTGLFLVSWAVMEYLYFFPLAAGMTLIAAALTIWSAVKMTSD